MRAQGCVAGWVCMHRGVCVAGGVHVSVILSMEVSARHPDGQTHTPHGQTHPTGQTHAPPGQTPTQQTRNAAEGTHPTGMHTCYREKIKLK